MEKENKQKTNIHKEREERILSFWKDNNTFDKSVKKENPLGDYTFYDGPPFATGLPHYGHLLTSIIKDVIPRWKTMQGYRVNRKWGWDCHGLPVENLIEKELDLKSKKDIYDFGVGKFNQAAEDSVMRYADEWRKIIPRIGRWIDMDNDYRTMDATYTESVWWIFEQLYNKGLIYEGFKSMFLCPRCETTLSNFEVAQGYKDITDISVFVKFHAKNSLPIINNDHTYFLAWTTTPWTLPGNVALAVNPEMDYVKIKLSGEEGKPVSEDEFILSKDRLSVIKNRYQVTGNMKGSDLVGLLYDPLFDYYSKDKNIKNIDKGWKIYGAEFVTTEDGTGIVHIAPAFGADDYDLLLENDLPFVQHVTYDGKFKPEVSDFEGMSVKPIDTPSDKNAHQKADVEIIKHLAHKGSLFDKEKIVHSYPHCWRCDTPLLNYATSSWFVKVTAIRNDLVKENSKIVWVPKEVGEGRFGNWLAGARDWAISRSRFWGAPIPVWRGEKTGKVHVIGSIAKLRKYSKSKNTYSIIRHGEATNNTEGILNSDTGSDFKLTKAGREQVMKAVKEIKKIKPDLIFVSPLERTRETADILKSECGWKDESIIIDERLHELSFGKWDGRKLEEYLEEFRSEDRFEKNPEGGENYSDIRKRAGEFLYDIESKYEGKSILIVTHETVAFLMLCVAEGLSKKEIVAIKDDRNMLKNAEFRTFDFAPLPHNKSYEIDLHRPYIDDVPLFDNGERLIRVSDVFDCWFESGAMPFGSNHYPFENADKFDPSFNILHKSKGYPADFIAEGLDQTRGWFYSMLVLGVALFGKSPFKKVIVNGLILAEDGEKMSKRKKNYPDPMEIVEKYGADSLRYYLLSSPVVHSEDLRFSEKGVDEITKKIVNRLLNVVSFYETYSPNELVVRSEAKDKLREEKSGKNVLDIWILNRLVRLRDDVTRALEAGELDRSVRPFMDFIDDLSTWYLRRSRDRFKGENEKDTKDAVNTTETILRETSKLLAPFMPFLAEEIFQKVSKRKGESVHMEKWPSYGKSADEKILIEMESARKVASLGLQARMKSDINVRQPLSVLRVKSIDLKPVFDSEKKDELVNLILEEVNIKKLEIDDSLQSDYELDTTITSQLKEEGLFREFVRSIQDLRKEAKLSVKDEAVLYIEAEEQGLRFMEKNWDKLKKVTLLSDIRFEPTNAKEMKIGDLVLKMKVVSDHVASS